MKNQKPRNACGNSSRTVLRVFSAIALMGTPLFAQYTTTYSRQTGAVVAPAPQHQPGQTSGEPSQVVIYQPTPSTFAPFCEGGGGPAGASEARSELLDKKGPQLAGVFNMSNFSIMGFAKGSWPVVVDYFLEQDSLLIVVVAPEGMEPAIYHLEGKKGHWQSRINLPASIGPKPVVAHYAIRALDDNIGQVATSHLHLHGIAVGEKAVGSIGIDQVSFSPSAIHVAMGEQAHYMFHSKMDFKNVDVDFVRLAVSQGQIIAARIGGKSMGSINRNDQRTGNWDGKSDGGGKYAQSYPPELRNWLKAPQGQHLVQVRAWWGAKDGDWATALSDDYVTVE
jgi:hypothetical protein